MTHETICPACGETVTIEFDYQEAERETWGYSGGSPAIPASVEVYEQDCPECGYSFEAKERKLMEEEIRSQEY